MDLEHEQRLFALLQQALTWERESFQERLEEACRDSPVRPAEVLELLKEREELGEFLAVSPLEELSVEASLPKVGDHIGPYRLLEVLGEGGMGRVFLAQQQQPVQRRVALKLIRSESFSPQSRTRFLAEQQALARLANVHIAHLLDAGMSKEGVAYFAMEWIDGPSIDRYCDEHRLPLDQRLEIFLDVCSALQHAHRKQVLHRDLKPSNVLVTVRDGRALVKVIDFGIAKILDGQLGDAGPNTGDHILGTPAYLAPEAFRGDVDTRSDVYSLGVLLYQLLVGSRPFDEDSASLGELIVRIERGEAVFPSEALRCSASEDIAKARGSTVRALVRQVEGDLDAIVATAMATDPENRYGSPAELAADLERYRRAEPIEARVLPWTERWKKILQRNRGKAVAATLVFSSLVAGIIGTSLGMIRAEHEAEVARRSLEESEALASFLGNLFEANDPRQARGAEASARELLDRGAERIRVELLEQPAARARILATLGDIYGSLGLYDQGRLLLEESLVVLRTVKGIDDQEIGAALHRLGVLATNAGRFEEARDHYMNALQIQESFAESAPRVAMTHYHLGVIDFRVRNLTSAEAHFSKARSIWSRESGSRVELARVSEGFGALRLEQGRLGEAESLYLEALEARSSELGEDHPHVAATLDSLCRLYTEMLNLDEARTSCQRALEIRERSYGALHAEVAMSYSALARVFRMQGDFEESEVAIRRALEIGSEVLEPDHYRMSRWWASLGWHEFLLERYSESRVAYQKAYDIRLRTLGQDTPSLSIPLVGLGICAWKTGKFELAESFLERSLEIENRQEFKNRAIAWPLWGLAGVTRDRGDQSRGDLERSKNLYERALKIRRESYSTGHEALVILENDYQQFLARYGTQQPSISSEREGDR